MLLRARAILVLLLLVTLFSILAPSFLTAANLSILSKHVAISAILAIGMTFVILSGGIDLSVGSVAGLSGMVAGYILTEGIPVGSSDYHPGILVALLAAFLICLVVGALNGWLVSRAGVAPFIATLGTLYIARGAALLISNGKTFPNLTARVACLWSTSDRVLSSASNSGLDDAVALRESQPSWPQRHRSAATSTPSAAMSVQQDWRESSSPA